MKYQSEPLVVSEVYGTIRQGRRTTSWDNGGENSQIQQIPVTS